MFLHRKKKEKITCLQKLQIGRVIFFRSISYNFEKNILA